MRATVLIGFGLVVGVAASFTGLGGGFLMVPLLLFMGYAQQRAVGTSMLAVSIISLSALIAHLRSGNVDAPTGVLLAVGGVVGAQLGPRLLAITPGATFNRIFALILVALAVQMFLKK